MHFSLKVLSLNRCENKKTPRISATSLFTPGAKNTQNVRQPAAHDPGRSRLSDRMLRRRSERTRPSDAANARVGDAANTRVGDAANEIARVDDAAIARIGDAATARVPTQRSQTLVSWTGAVATHTVCML